MKDCDGRHTTFMEALPCLKSDGPN